LKIKDLILTITIIINIIINEEKRQNFNNNNAGGGWGGSNFNNNNAGGGWGGNNFNNNNAFRKRDVETQQKGISLFSLFINIEWPFLNLYFIWLVKRQYRFRGNNFNNNNAGGGFGGNNFNNNNAGGFGNNFNNNNAGKRDVENQLRGILTF
jgi:hypothetical protein